MRGASSRTVLAGAPGDSFFLAIADNMMATSTLPGVRCITKSVKEGVPAQIL